MTATTPTTETHTELFARKARETHEQFPHTDTHTQAMNHVLADMHHFDATIRRGELATSCGELRSAITFGGLARLAFHGETEQDVRTAVKAYAEWLLKVANNAQ